MRTWFTHRVIYHNNCQKQFPSCKLFHDYNKQDAILQDIVKIIDFKLYIIHNFMKFILIHLSFFIHLAYNSVLD
mgnify:CR=1 FL=1